LVLRGQKLLTAERAMNSRKVREENPRRHHDHDFEQAEVVGNSTQL
jgi:hypothetical protein